MRARASRSLVPMMCVLLFPSNLVTSATQLQACASRSFTHNEVDDCASGGRSGAGDSAASSDLCVCCCALLPTFCVHPVFNTRTQHR